MLSSNVLLCLGIALVAGLFSNRLIKLAKLPNVTGYLIVGILLGPYLFGLFFPNYGGILTKELIEGFSVIVDLALGFIAFSIGSEFKLSSIKKLGKGVITITFVQATCALLFVDLGLTVLCLINGTITQNLPLVLTLGAVATATAPAATLMVIKQYKAKGPVTDILLPVVAFDDAVGLILYSISFSIAQVFAKQYAGVEGATISFYSIAIVPLLEIVVSLGVGGILGFILTFTMKWFKSRANRLMCMISAVLLGVATCKVFADFVGLEVSSLLTCMMIGAVFCNLRSDAIHILDGAERWTPPLFMLFFILSGAELNLSLMGNLTVIIICLIYLLTRSLGKYFGARWGCSMVGKGGTVKKFLGLTLLPQAGVAIGMARSSSNAFNSIAHTSLAVGSAGFNYLIGLGSTLVAVVLCATLVYELFGPVVTKISLAKAGEIPSEKRNKDVFNQNENATPKVNE